jgi:hypothetical protein
MVEVAGNQRIPPESPHRRRFPSNRTASASHGLADMVSAALLEIGARP